jgi:hypothetical protein
MKFKSVGAHIPSYQCYIINIDCSTTRIARIDAPHEIKDRGCVNFWKVTFAKGHANGRVHNLLAIINKIKRLTKEYR